MNAKQYFNDRLELLERAMLGFALVSGVLWSLVI
jgi:hypothetical protein